MTTATCVSGPGNQGRSTWGTSHGACLEFPRETSIILRCAGKAGRKACADRESAAAKSLQSCPTLCDHIDGSPPGFPVPGILQLPTPLALSIVQGYSDKEADRL